MAHTHASNPPPARDPKAAAESLADEPVGTLADDGLDFARRYAVPLAKRIAADGPDDPVTIGIFGPWGSGKSSLMNLVRRLVTGDDKIVGFSPARACVAIEINAWKFVDEQSLWRVIVSTILDRLLREPVGGSSPHAQPHHNLSEEIRAVRESLYGDVTVTRRRLQANWPRLVGAVVSGGSIIAAQWLQMQQPSKTSVAAQIALGGIALCGGALVAFGARLIPAEKGEDKKFDGLEKIGGAAKDIADAFEVVDDVLTSHRRLEYLEQFSDAFNTIVQRYLGGRRLVLFIDDMDRCLPEKAVQVLEGIKLFMGVKNTVFVLGVDVPVLARGIEFYYAQRGLRENDAAGRTSMVNGLRYLEKLVQLPTHIPPMDFESIAESELFERLKASVGERAIEIGVKGFGGNPRAVKRFARIFAHRREVIESTDPAALTDREAHLAKIVVLQEHPDWRPLIDLMVAQPRTRARELRLEDPLILLEGAARFTDKRQKLLSQTESGVSILGTLARNDEFYRFMNLEPYFLDGTAFVDPLPLILFAGGKGADAQNQPAPLATKDLPTMLASTDQLARSRALAAVHEIDPNGRRTVVSELLGLVAHAASAPQPDANGLPEAVDSLQKIYRLGIEQELLRERVGTLSQVVASMRGREGAHAASDAALIALLADIGEPQTPRSAATSMPAAVVAPPAATSVPSDVIAPPAAPAPAQLPTIPAGAFAGTVPITPDQPVGDDLLDFTKYTSTLLRLIREARSPMTIGVFGKWGTGKSSFMHFMRRGLDHEGRYATAWINLSERGGDAPFAVIRDALERVFPRLAVDFTYKEVPGYENELGDALKSLLGDEKPMVLFVDDIDRCSPQIQAHTLRITEALKRSERIFTVIAADPDLLLQALAPQYGALRSQDSPANREKESRALLEKWFHVIFQMPGVTREAVERLISVQVEQPTGGDALRALARFVDTNPREIKRFVERFNLARAVTTPEVADDLLATVVLLQIRWPKLIDHPRDLLDLWQTAKHGISAERSRGLDRIQDKVGGVLDADVLMALLRERNVPEENQLSSAISQASRFTVSSGYPSVG